MKYILLFAMIFCHIVDDYYLQGILAQLKQRDWWKKNYPDSGYRFDYIIALIEHAFSWSFMVLLPPLYLMIVNNHIVAWQYIYTFMLLMIPHALIDHLKANLKSINLFGDQLFHILQIVIVWALWAFVYLKGVI